MLEKILLENTISCYLRDNSQLQRSTEFDILKGLKTNDTFSKKKDNNKHLKRVVTS